MKIIVSSNTVKRYKKLQEEATKGCDVCPECGYKLNLFYFPTCRTYTEGFFKIKHMQVNCYRCPDCGCAWESEPFPY